jgi:hypothetical protein
MKGGEDNIILLQRRFLRGFLILATVIYENLVHITFGSALDLGLPLGKQGEGSNYKRGLEC